MAKIIKKLVAAVMVVALTVTGINFTPNQIGAATGDYVVCQDSVWTTNSDWQSYAGKWSSSTNPSTAQYKGGDSLTNYELNVITNDPNSGNEAQMYAIQARSGYQTVEAGVEYVLRITLNSTGSAGKKINFNVEDNKLGEDGTNMAVLSTQIQKLKVGENVLECAFTPSTNQIRVAFGLGLLNAGTSVEVTSFSIEKATADADTMINLTLEAEAGTLGGEATIIASDSFSNGYGVGNIGGNTNGTLLFWLNISAAQTVVPTIQLASGEDRGFAMITKSGGYYFGPYNTGDFLNRVTEYSTASMQLQEGWDCLYIYGYSTDGVNYEWTPNIDKVQVQLNRTDAVATVDYMISVLPTGDITPEQAAVIAGVKAAYDSLDAVGKSRLTYRNQMIEAYERIEDLYSWTAITGDDSQEYYYKYSTVPNSATLTVQSGTVEQTNDVHFVFDEAIASAVLKDGSGNTVSTTISGAGVTISKYNIKPNQSYTLELTGSSKSATLELKYEPVVDSENIALNKQVYVDSEQLSETIAGNVTDGSPYTRWASNSTGQNGYVYVDLGNLYEIEKVDVLFEAAYAKDFEIQLSKDGKTWVTAKTVSNFLNGERHDNEGYLTYTTNDMCLGKGRFVKIKVNAMQSYHNRLSIYELKVYGTKLPGYIADVAVKKEITANGEKSVANGDSQDLLASYATDGKDTTRWAVDKSVSIPEYTINLGKMYELHSIDIKFAQAYATAFTILTSKNGQDWTILKNVSGWTDPGSTSSLASSDLLGYSFHFDPVNAQYVKLAINTFANSNWGASIWEFEVWAKDNDKLDYWTSFNPYNMGVYPVTKLQDTTYPNSINDTYDKGKIDSTLVSGDILLEGETYEVVYNPDDRDLYFYVNPWRINVDYTTQSVFWSNGNSGYMLWGADNHDENIAKFVAKQEATVYYQLAENLDFGGNDYVTTQIGCRIYNNSDLTDGVPNSGASPVFSTKFNLKIYDSYGIYIQDNIAKNGTIQVKDYSTAKRYVWEKSIDGENWEPVAEKKYDITVISNSGATVNVANDFGGGYYYRVKEEGGVWSRPYQVKYYNNVQNGDFEYPAMFSSDEETHLSLYTRLPLNLNGDEQQYPNGWDGLFWKTTGPGWYNNHNGIKTANDIEIVNARNLRSDLIMYNNWTYEQIQQSGFSVSSLQMYGDNSHGDQFAELNCEEQGALYQDILTTPGAECYWDLDHAARRITGGATNSMLVVAMSTNDASNYTQDTQLDQIVATVGDIASVSSEYEEGKKITLPDGSEATVWKVTSTTTAGEWKHNSGRYTVPLSDENYLTRFFFVSIDGTGGNRTIGNFLDNVTFEQKKAYRVEYYVDGQLVYTTPEAIVDPYDRVDIPSTIPSSTGYNLAEYTMRASYILQYERDADGNILYDDNGNPKQVETAFYIDDNDRRFTVAYDHDTIRLYYERGIVTLLKRVDGMTSIPDGYEVRMTVKDAETQEVKITHTFTKDDFTAIEEVDGSTPDSFFATIAYNATEEGLVSGRKYIISEENVDTMIDTSYYLSEIAVRDQLHKVTMSELQNGTTSFSDAEMEYKSNAQNTEMFVNTYAPTHKVTLTKKVTGNMGETDKDFNFTVNIAKDSEAINAVLCDDDTVTSSETGKYQFTLKDTESISFLVYDGSTVTVTEQKEAWYSTTYTVEGVKTSVNNGVEVDGTSDPVVTTNAITADVDITCVNHSEDLGDVEVQGFQMNTDTSVGAPAEFSPSFRVVCRVSKNTIKRKKVVKAGIIFGTAAAIGSTEEDAIAKMVIKNAVTGNDSDNLEDDGTAGAIKDGVDGKIADNIFYHEETPDGYYTNWTTKEDDEHPYTHWNYYALTFYGTSYLHGMLTQDITYRAYAIVEGTEDDHDYVEDGKYYKYEYGNDIYTINLFEIAQNLYENQKMSTLAQHNFLYNNILNVVTMDKNRLQIANAMMVKLNITAKDHNYNMVNACYKNLYDYIHCLSGYKYKDRGTAVPNKDFKLKNYIVESGYTSETYNTELLEKLNESTGTEYGTISEWIYAEVEKTLVKNSTDTYYTGFYRKASYDWNSGIITDFDEDK